MAQTRMQIPDSYHLYTTSNHFFFQPFFHNCPLQKCLKVSRDAKKERLEIDTLPSNKFFPPPSSNCTTVYGIFGIIHLAKGTYFVLIREKILVGVFSGHAIYNIKKFDILPFCSNSLLNTENIATDLGYLQRLEKTLNGGCYYYSYTYDLTTSCQRNFQKRNFNYNGVPLSQQADRRFFWNHRVSKNLLTSDLTEFVLPVIRGSIILKRNSINFNNIDTFLIARCSRRRAGTRYNVRGIDYRGNCANFVEVEQILLYNDLIASYVQTRGSIPLHWTQNVNIKYKPPIQVLGLDHSSSMQNHFREQVDVYGSQTLIDLIDQKGSEKVLGSKYKSEVDRLCNPNIFYISFDYHAENKKLKNGKALQYLMESLTFYRQKHSYFLGNAMGSIFKLQNGVFRTNCMDCLDRTNVVQSMIARLVLQQQLDDLYGLSMESVVNQNINFEASFRNMWADNADALSTLYSGTGALKTDMTRTGKRTYYGMYSDLKNSLMRYYLNNFCDGFRQDGLEILVGNHQIRNNFIDRFAESPRHRILKKLPLLLVSCILLLSVYFLFGESWRYTILLAATTLTLLLLTSFFGKEIVDSPRLWIDSNYTEPETTEQDYDLNDSEDHININMNAIGHNSSSDMLGRRNSSSNNLTPSHNNSQSASKRDSMSHNIHISTEKLNKKQW